MIPRIAKITTCIATLIATAAIGVSPALALGPLVFPASRPHVTPVPTASRPHVTPALSVYPQPPNLPHVDHASAGSFSWPAMAIGALVAAAVCVVVIGLAFSVRRRHEPTASPGAVRS